MKSIKTAILVLVIGCAFPAILRGQQQESELRQVMQAGVSLVYNTNDFDDVIVETEKKLTAQDAGDDVPIGIAPEHFCFNLKDKRPLPALDIGPRYFYPTHSFICAIPLRDPSVPNFGSAYPDLNSAAARLQKMLRQRPRKVTSRKNVPDIPYNNASPSILGRFQYFDFRSGSGILFLTQYSQELEPNPVNNEELTLNFQGLTKDGSYYIAGRLAITHPSLPKGIDYTENIKRDKQNLYLRKAEKDLQSLPEETFQPSLKRLKALLSSVEVK